MITTFVTAASFSYIYGTSTISFPLITSLFSEPHAIDFSHLPRSSCICTHPRPHKHVMIPNKLRSYARPTSCRGIMTWKSSNSTTIVEWVTSALWLVHSNALVTWKSVGSSPHSLPVEPHRTEKKPEPWLTEHRNQDRPPAASKHATQW